MHHDDNTLDLSNLPPAERLALESEAQMIAHAPGLMHFGQPSSDGPGGTRLHPQYCEDISD